MWSSENLQTSFGLSNEWLTNGSTAYKITENQLKMVIDLGDNRWLRVIVEEIFTNILEVRRVAAKLVPKLLNFEQRVRRQSIIQEKIDDVLNYSTLL